MFSGVFNQAQHRAAPNRLTAVKTGGQNDQQDDAHRRAFLEPGSVAAAEPLAPSIMA
jgi:hypothetical protein